jgi:hypothetical protein
VSGEHDRDKDEFPEDEATGGSIPTDPELEAALRAAADSVDDGGRHDAHAAAAPYVSSRNASSADSGSSAPRTSS